MFSAAPIRSLLIALCLCAGLAACSDDERPAYLLPTEKIVPILKEMQIAYAGIDVTEQNEEARKKKYAEMNALILDRFGVNADTFYLSYEFYQNHPEILDTIYMRVIEELNLEMMPMQKRRVQPKGRQLEEQ